MIKDSLATASIYAACAQAVQSISIVKTGILCIVVSFGK